MSTYKKKQKEVLADHWFKIANTEAERIVDYFRHPYIKGSWICNKCGKQMKSHGWIDAYSFGEVVHANGLVINNTGLTVCPGNWVVEDEKWDGHYNILTNKEFKEQYEKCEDTLRRNKSEV